MNIVNRNNDNQGNASRTFLKKWPYQGVLLGALRKISTIPDDQRLLDPSSIDTHSKAHPFRVYAIKTLILSFLEAEDVVRATRDLPRGWGDYQIDELLGDTTLATDSRFKVIDKSVWYKCFGRTALEEKGLSFLENPSLKSLNDLRLLDRLASISVEEDVGFTLLTLPQNLTLSKLIDLVKTPLSKKSLEIDDINCSLHLFSDRPIEGGLVAISNGLLTGSRPLSISEQKALLETHDCQMPRLIDVVSLCFLTYIDSSFTENNPVRLLKGELFSSTRCIDQTKNSIYHFVVGLFSGCQLGICNSQFGGDNDGVCALKNLESK